MDLLLWYLIISLSNWLFSFSSTSPFMLFWGGCDTIISLPVLWSRFISVINIQLNILNQYDGQSNWSKYLPLPGLFYLLLVEVSHPWSNKVVHKGSSPRASKLPCGESGFAIRENTDKTKKILEARYENWFYIWFSYLC